jgi:hypothetical protein
MLAANIWTEPKGYAIVKGRANYRKSDGSVQKIWAQCDRFGKPRYSADPTARKRPNRGSRKCECMIEASISEIKRGNNIWEFTVINATHNHDLTTEPDSHPLIRKIYKDDKFKEIIAAYKAAGILARDTLTSQLIKNPILSLTQLL